MSDRKYQQQQLQQTNHHKYSTTTSRSSMGANGGLSQGELSEMTNYKVVNEIERSQHHTAAASDNRVRSNLTIENLRYDLATTQEEDDDNDDEDENTATVTKAKRGVPSLPQFIIDNSVYSQMSSYRSSMKGKEASVAAALAISSCANKENQIHRIEKETSLFIPKQQQTANVNNNKANNDGFKVPQVPLFNNNENLPLSLMPINTQPAEYLIKKNKVFNVFNS